MPTAPTITISHVSFHCFDLDAMVDFYTRVLGFRLTDRGKIRGDKDIAFLSGDARDHHQLALIEGRTDDTAKHHFNHVAFRIDSLASLRALRERLMAEGIDRFHPINHGMAWSIYFRDPEGNQLEAFVDSDIYVEQPVGDSLDLSLPDEEIRRANHEAFDDRPATRPFTEWRAEFARGGRN